MDRELIVKILRSQDLDRDVLVQGWVRTRRDAKGFSFMEVNDGSCLANLQVIVDEQSADYHQIGRWCNGAAIQIQGRLVPSQGKGQKVEMQAKQIWLIGSSGEDYPLQKKRHTYEYLRTISHLRPRTNAFGAVFRLRNAISFAIHSFFQSEGFLHLHSPIITTSDCEGAGQLFQVTTLDMRNVPLKPPTQLQAGKPDSLIKSDKAIDYSRDFFACQSSLTVSGQLEGECFAQAFSKIYTFGPTFRAENSNTARHLAEFWMVEPEMAFCDLSMDMDLAEAFIKTIIDYALNHCTEDMQFFDTWLEKGILASLESVAKASFERIDYQQAIDILVKANKRFEFPVQWGLDLQTEHERYLCDEFFKKPVFVTGYPKQIKAFYMRLNDDGRTVAAMDLLVPRLGEIIGGSQREERIDYLEKAILAQGLSIQEYWWYLDLRRFGSTPHAGFGLGLERLLMYMTGMQNIRDVIPFPRTPGHAEF